MSRSLDAGTHHVFRLFFGSCAAEPRRADYICAKRLAAPPSVLVQCQDHGPAKVRVGISEVVMGASPVTSRGRGEETFPEILEQPPIGPNFAPQLVGIVFGHHADERGGEHCVRHMIGAPRDFLDDSSYPDVVQHSHQSGF